MRTYIIAILLLLSNLNKSYAQRIDTLIKTGTYSLHLKVIKGNAKTILFESGGALDASQWDTISTRVHNILNATVITYDRRGSGKGDIDTNQYNILNEIKGLELALTKLGYGNSDMLLVSHSLGAFYSMLYANRNPHLMKGIIMFDPRIASRADIRYAREVYKKLDRNQFKKEERWLYYVLATMESNSNIVRKISLEKKIPILDIMAEFGPFESQQENERFQLAQIDFVKRKQNATLLYLKGTSHNIPQDKPEVVINEIVKFYKYHLN